MENTISLTIHLFMYTLLYRASQDLENIAYSISTAPYATFKSWILFFTPLRMADAGSTMIDSGMIITLHSE